MKLWQYIAVIVLMIGSYTIGDGFGYNFGYNEGYTYGYRDGVFDEGWNAAILHNTTHLTVCDDTFYRDAGVWAVTVPEDDYNCTLHHYDGVRWIQADGYTERHTWLSRIKSI